MTRNAAQVGVVRLDGQRDRREWLNERLLSSPRCVLIPEDSRGDHAEDEPPPKSVFAVLDRPVVAGDAKSISLWTTSRNGWLVHAVRPRDRPCGPPVRDTSQDRQPTSKSAGQLAETCGNLLTDGGA